METDKSRLTAAEMGKLWVAYVGNTMEKCVLSHYLKHVDDTDTKRVLEYALGLTKTFIEDIKKIFKQADFPIPIGFTEDDVNLEAPRLFYDDFYLYYLQYLGKAGMSIYSVAIPLVTRKDVKDFFIKALSDTVKLMSDVSDVLISKGRLMNTPVIPAPEKVDFVHKQNFLSGYFGEVRPPHGLEIAHLYGCINNDVTSKALILGFNQGAKNENVKKFLERGKNINQKHIELLSDKLSKDNIPSPTILDHLVTTSTTTTFSDKLMVYHKIDMFSMKIREYANAASLNGRKDIGVLFAKCQSDVSFYVEDGANLLIDLGWMEQPPEAVDRDNLSSKE
ncbi:DUF3231 family protein [Niallia endozanthoxylica]|uniref:DUF3231 family protein n=1 Tax=Niallia endozanthoxylica TaxID=2036016 RepID=A0A5J5HR11_9BACI|nr:DUF3231 family protein [Niallia endozanthoxylica]KAA9022896.1 DUF3231 family protein [Niallia endozanthoxylica]